jgi:16S rRNA pseudouridine516 synthase
MFGAMGNHVEALHRFRLGGLTLEGLDEGQYKILDAVDVTAIFG